MNSEFKALQAAEEAGIPTVLDTYGATNPAEFFAVATEARRAFIQDILAARVMHAPIYELAFIWGVGPRVEEAGINLIRSFAYSGPLEDVRLKRP